jgi:hypothetical protein
MEFNLEEPHGLTCPQHTVAHDSTDGTLWEICRITGMRKVDGVQEFCVAWAQTWMPESELGGARELVNEFKARLSVRHRKKNGQGKTDVTGDGTAKRRRGQPQSLEDVQQLCAAAFPLHTSSAGSNASFSAQPSRSKRPRFTEEEDAKLVDLKERRDWSWEDIQRSFPGRSTGSLQVRYSTKLKDRNTAS